MSKLYLVGAGPGDPELLTLKAKRILQIADIVLYDFLVHPNILYYAQKAEKICVGKRKGNHSAKQETINQLIIKYAKQNKTVIRLKGGDPFIFGRGGEEVAVCVQHNIPIEVIPGITSAIAAPAYAGIPLTHRNQSRSVAFVTGTLSTGKEIDPNDYPDADTLVFLMGITHIQKITTCLIKKKRFNEDTKAALIYKGTTAHQKTVKGTLKTIARQQVTENIKPPALLVVGEVVDHANIYNWAEIKPLSGKRIILCRPYEQSQVWAEKLSDLGAEVILNPLIDITESSERLPDLAPITTIIFTSRYGVAYFHKKLFQQKKDNRVLANKIIVSIGKATAKSLNDIGIQPNWIATEETSQGILKQLPNDLRNEHVLIPTSNKANSLLKREIENRNGVVQK